MAIPASFVVAEATDFSGGESAEEVLASLQSDPEAVSVVVDGTDAMRSMAETVGTDDVTGKELRVRQVVHTVPVPASYQWLVIVFDILLGVESDASMHILRMR